MADHRQLSGPIHSRALVVGALGLAQTLAWGSSYYLPAILADPISAGVGVPRSWVFGALSSALLIAAFAGPAVGRIVDRRGGRGVLALSNIVLAGGLVALAVANGPVLLFAAWAVLGVGMALGLYDTAFAALSALYGRDARGPITGITLIAGFASTVSWPPYAERLPATATAMSPSAARSASRRPTSRCWVPARYAATASRTAAGSPRR